jgi:hypothetical protein
MSDLPEGKPTATKKNGRTGFSETIGNMPFMRRSVNKSLETIQDRKKRQEQEILHKEETLNFLDNVADGILGVSKESGASNDRGKKSLVFVTNRRSMYITGRKSFRGANANVEEFNRLLNGGVAESPHAKTNPKKEISRKRPPKSDIEKRETQGVPSKKKRKKNSVSRRDEFSKKHKYV